MGKYMRKPKETCDVAVTELVSSPLGVRTRAKTLALQKKLQSTTPISDTSSCYLQLRSRMLHKQNPNPLKNPNSKPQADDSIGENDLDFEGRERKFTYLYKINKSLIPKHIPRKRSDWNIDVVDSGLESRSDRESTPCSYGRESLTAGTPDSTNKQMFSTVTDLRTHVSNSITLEIEEFFASAEKQQQRLFAERFNFDVVNDMPLPGRYEWVRVGN